MDKEKDDRVNQALKRLDRVCKMLDILEETKESYKADYEATMKRIDNIRNDLEKYVHDMVDANKCITSLTGVCVNNECHNFTCQMHSAFHTPKI